MPFLLPALVAFVCDVCVIWLSSITKRLNYDDIINTTATATTTTWMYDTIDLYCGTISATIRIIILCIPLLYHSYTGTALQHMIWYRTIYIGMILLITFHILVYIITAPTSIESLILILPTPDQTTSSSSSTSSTPVSLEVQYEYRRLWLILLLSSISLFIHHILVRHVRSTAPTPPMMLRMLYNKHLKTGNDSKGSNKNNPYFCIGYSSSSTMLQNSVKPTMYFVVRTAAAAAAAAATTMTTTSSSTSTSTASQHNPVSNPRYSNNNGTNSLPTTLPLDNDIDSDNHSTDSRRGIVQEPALINAMNEFLMDMQIRLQRTKQVWSSRLEDFGHRIQQQQQQIQQQTQSRESSNSSTTNTNTTTTVASSSLSLFRVLLQLFAYEDVLDNHKLDAEFDADDGIALTFYVPQLLSFLLHGALYTSPALEEWILNKCRKNIYFAHRCYWYLRAWCLEVPAESRPITPSISRRNSASSLTNNNLTNGAIGMILSQQNMNQSMYNDGSLPYLDEPAILEKKQLNNSNKGSSRNLCLPDNNSNSSTSQNDGRPLSVTLPNGIIVTSPTATTAEKDKFLIPEERAMIERFMMRVKECGQIPALVLEYGTSTYRNGSAESPETFMNNDSPEKRSNKLVYRGVNPNMNENAPGRPTNTYATISTTDHRNTTTNEVLTLASHSISDAERIPSDPSTGSPSKAHSDAMLLKQNCIDCYGFRSLHSTTTDDHDTIKVTLVEDTVRQNETEQFDKTPQFLDALIFLAENLYYVPRENRRETLQQQLRSLECELLPCNSIYLPIGSRNQYHRVWRIVPDESIAISTKERVPCIIALEVVDFSAPIIPSSNIMKEMTNGKGRYLDGTVNDSDSSYSGSSHPIASNNPSYSSDSDIVSEWRFGHRNPLRYVPFLDKVTTSVKVPFAKMKTQVRDHINNYRDRGVSEEMQALSSADVLVESNINPTNKFDYDPISTSVIEDRNISNIIGPTDDMIDAEKGLSKGSNNESVPALSRMNSAGSIISLGQWSSPTTLSRAVSHSDEKRQDDLDDIRFRFDSTLTKRKRRNSPLLYGSDQEDEPSERSVNSMSGRPPTGRQPSTTATVVKETIEQAVTSRPPPVVFRESWVAKQERVRQKSVFGDHPGWKLLAILVKGNDDLRQEQMAAQLIQRMATILACEKVNVWLCPYEIIATTNRGGVIEAIPDTISIDSLKKNDPNYTTLNNFFLSHYGEDTDELAGAKANFVESLAAYSMVCFILQLKDRHNGNILLDKWGHIIHIDFGFFFLSSPGKNAGFESAPFKLTREFVELLEGTNSHLFRTFRELCFKAFIALRRRCMEIILLVEMLKNGNEELKCFRGRPDDAIQQLRDRFRLDLNDRACKEYVNCLIDDSIENWRTDWYDRYQRYFVGVL